MKIEQNNRAVFANHEAKENRASKIAMAIGASILPLCARLAAAKDQSLAAKSWTVRAPKKARMKP